MGEAAVNDAETGGGVRLGLRFVLLDEDGQWIASISREDIVGAAVPRVGEQLGRGSLDPDLTSLVGLDPVVRQVRHFLRVPGADTKPPFVVVDVEATARMAPVRALEDSLKSRGWHVSFPWNGSRDGDD